jgi:uncharacterized membrane protein (UPF0127 family)
LGISVARLGLVVFSVMAQPALADCRQDSVSLRGPGGASMQFTVEVADDNAKRAQGLMNREKLAKSAGMLFLYETPRRAQFWMENTLIPLDMIFADETGRVTRVHSNAVPLDRTPIDGGDQVLAVLEINGGLAARLGIEAGFEMRHPLLDQKIAAWPCD